MLTISELASWFARQRHFTGLSPNSQRLYTRCLNQLVSLLGPDKVAASLDAEQVDSLIELVTTEKGSHAAITLSKVSKRLYNVAKRYTKQTAVTTNPFEKMGMPTLPPRRVVWTEEQVWDFYHTSKKMGRRSLGMLALCCYTFGQRPVDMRSLKWEDIHGNSLLITQQKTKVDIRIFIPEFMEELLDETPKTSEYVIVKEKDNQPYDERLYNIWAYDVKKRARIPLELKLADLRRTAFTEMGDSGATDQELLSFGHINRQELTTYTVRSVNQSKNAQNKRFGTKKHA